MYGIIATMRLLYFYSPFSRPWDGQPKKTANYTAKLCGIIEYYIPLKSAAAA